MKRTESGLLRRRATKPRSGPKERARRRRPRPRGATASSVTRSPVEARLDPGGPRRRRPAARPSCAGDARPAAAASATVRTSTLAGSGAGSAIEPSLATTTRFSGDCPSCLSARPITVRPAERHHRARRLVARRGDHHVSGSHLSLVLSGTLPRHQQPIENGGDLGRRARVAAPERRADGSSPRCRRSGRRARNGSKAAR